MKEADVQRQSLDYLALRGIFHYRNNSGAFRREDGHFYRFGAARQPGHHLHHHRPIGIRSESAERKAKRAPERVSKNLERVGGHYILAYSLDDVTSSL